MKYRPLSPEDARELELARVRLEAEFAELDRLNRERRRPRFLNWFLRKFRSLQ